MFSVCSSLGELNLSSFNINNVIDLSFMFYECLLLKELDLSNFYTSNVTYMMGIFSGCTDELKNKINKQNKNIFINIIKFYNK